MGSLGLVGVGMYRILLRVKHRWLPTLVELVGSRQQRVEQLQAAIEQVRQGRESSALDSQ